MCLRWGSMLLHPHYRGLRRPGGGAPWTPIIAARKLAATDVLLQTITQAVTTSLVAPIGPIV
jgi:hypothetical protein